MPDFIPKFRLRTPKRFSEEKWLDFEEPQVILFQGMRGSGKGVAVESTAEKLYKEGVNIWHIWGARSFENVYWAINKNCESEYSKMKTILKGFYEDISSLKNWSLSKGLTEKEHHHYLDLLIKEEMVNESDDGFSITAKGIQLVEGNLMHCKCNRAYPIYWIIPDYIQINQESLDRFNNQCWLGIEEYQEKFSMIVPFEDVEKLKAGLLKKPANLATKPLIKIAQFTTPTSAQRKETFREQFTKVVLDARDEHRIVVMNPAIFEGEMDKFETMTEIFRMIPYLMNKSGHFSPLTEERVGKARKYWTKKQTSWHKVAIVINELRSVAPSSKMHGEKSASSSKKAIFDFIPEARHYKTWFLGDYQNPKDLFDGVRHQANIVVIKRASRNILGDDWNWLFDKLERDQINWSRKLMKGRFELNHIEQVNFYKKRHPQLKRVLDSKIPLVDELPDNQGFITWINNEYKKETILMPSFHHKQSTEDFILDTGITWTVDLQKKPEKKEDLSKKEKKLAVQQQKKVRDEMWKKVERLRETEQKSWGQIKEELVLQENEGVIPNMRFASKTNAYFSNEYNKWKKKQESEGNELQSKNVVKQVI